MRFAVPVNGGMLSQHFGHCEQFAIIDVDENKKVQKELVSSPEHQPGLLPTWLAGKGVSVVIAGGMGISAQNLFQQGGIKVILGVQENDPEKAVMDYLNGSLSLGDNICEH